MTQDLLGIIGGVALQTAACLFILLLPVLLLVWTVRVVYRRRSFKDTKYLLILNGVVFFALMIIMISFNSGTIYEVIVTSYQVTGYMLPFVAIFGIYVWARDRYMLDLPSSSAPQSIRIEE